MKFSRPSKTDWMSCKKWTMDCIPFVLPLLVHLFLFTVLIVLSGRNIAKCVLQMCRTLAEKSVCSIVSNL